MKKRIAYIGLSFPLFYDYRNLAQLAQNDLSDSPNPIIESPLGLMILYDELWFLCESICPNNMRKLPYVKFVDKIYDDLYFEGADSFINDNMFELDYSDGLNYGIILKGMNLEKRDGLDTHTHILRLGETTVYASRNINNFMFDIYVFTALQERLDMSIELVTNSMYSLKDKDNYGIAAEAVEQIIIPNIPNYLSKDGPYHNCMEELRENIYLIDFRKWIVGNHSNLQKYEISEMKDSVEQIIKETQERVFKKYLEENNKYSFFKSTGKTILSTGLGCAFPELSIPISILDVVSGITGNAGKACKAKNIRWQGFVIDAQKIAQKNNL